MFLLTDILVIYQFYSINLRNVIKDCLLVSYIYINDILKYTFMKKQQHVTKTNIAMGTNITLSIEITYYPYFTVLKQ